jgi:hypothetical protein
MFSLAIQEAAKLEHKPHFPMMRENNVRAGLFDGGTDRPPKQRSWHRRSV